MKLFTITLLVLCCLLGAAQAPQQMNCQAIVRNGAGNPVAANALYQISLPYLASGFYLVKIQNSTLSFTEKIIIQ